jgi:hypothetical protein
MRLPDAGRGLAIRRSAELPAHNNDNDNDNDNDNNNNDNNNNNRLRHGQNLNVDWRYGAAHFEELLIDHDVTANWGNWNAAGACVRACVRGAACVRARGLVPNSTARRSDWVLHTPIYKIYIIIYIYIYILIICMYYHGTLRQSDWHSCSRPQLGQPERRQWPRFIITCLHMSFYNITPFIVLQLLYIYIYIY